MRLESNYVVLGVGILMCGVETGSGFKVETFIHWCLFSGCTLVMHISANFAIVPCANAAVYGCIRIPTDDTLALIALVHRHIKGTQLRSLFIYMTNEHMCMCVYTHLCMYVCMYVCMFTYATRQISERRTCCSISYQGSSKACRG